jgi:hypothetical protein
MVTLVLPHHDWVAGDTLTVRVLRKFIQSAKGVRIAGVVTTINETIGVLAGGAN